MGTKVYVVTMYRWGNHEDHSYVLGVWTNKIVAENYGITEEAYRGGKYDAEVTECDLDGNECDNI